MKALLLTFCLAFVAMGTARAQDDWPKANPNDVATVDALVAALYDVVSGPAGDRDWNRMRSLFMPGAKLIATGMRNGEEYYLPMALEDYITRNGDFFKQKGFWESEIARSTQEYAGLVAVFTTYEARIGEKDGEPAMRGINSLQLAWQNNRWHIVNLIWYTENEENPIPEAYLPQN